MVRIIEMLETHVYLVVQIERGRVAGRTVVVGVQRGAGQLVVHVQVQIVRARTQLQVVVVALFVVIVTCFPVRRFGSGRPRREREIDRDCSDNRTT